MNAAPQIVADECPPGFVLCPFTILVDSREKLNGDDDEQYAYEFRDIRDRGDVALQRNFHVPIRRQCLEFGDYSLEIDGESHAGRVSIERKSMADAHNTFLGWTTKEHKSRDLLGRRERFEKQLEAMSQMDVAAVVIECSYSRFVNEAPCYGRRSRESNSRVLASTFQKWDTQFRGVKFVFCDLGRRQAEIETFRRLHLYYRRFIQGEK